jgi:hypothetical protein
VSFFMQEAALHGAYLGNGHKLALDFVLDDTQNGYISTENGYIVSQIRASIASRSGGWLEISEAEYADALKKKALPPSPKSKFRNLNAGMFQPRVNQEEAALSAAGTVASKPDPIAVPTAEQMKLPPRPRVGKIAPK